MTISCIMPTRDRRQFVSEAIASFLLQTYEDSELIVVDDGDDPVADLMPSSDRVRYFCLPRAGSLGLKRNAAVRLSCGSYIAHWDDDDWYSPERLAGQMALIDKSGADLVGFHSALFRNLQTGQMWRWSDKNQVLGASMLYRRALWTRLPFADRQVGEDTSFAMGAANIARVETMDGSDLMIASIHAANTSPRTTKGEQWAQFR